MKKAYLPRTTGGKILRLAEECAEVAAACNKTARICMEWDPNDIEGALEGYNPELPESKRETNREWIWREIKDLEHAIKVVKKALT